MTREARGLGKDRGQAPGRPQVGGPGYEGLGKDRVDFLEEVAPGLGLKGFGGRMTLGEDLLWSRHVCVCVGVDSAWAEVWRGG